MKIRRFACAFAGGGLFLLCLGLLVAPLNAGELITPDQDAPQYKLSDLRIEQTKPGWYRIRFDYKRTKQGPGTIFVRGQSHGHSIPTTAVINSFQASGTIAFETYSPDKKKPKIDAEFYLVRFNSWGNNQYRDEMVSNSVKIGDPGESDKPRAWSDADTAAKKEFQKNGNKAKVDPDKIKHYKVDIAVPETSVFVPLLAKITNGTRLQACYANKWNPITALSENSNGTLFIRWDDYGPTFDCVMTRKELIIAKKDLSRLETHPASHWETASAPNALGEQNPDAQNVQTVDETRTWVDATGKFRVSAKLLQQTDSDVVILTAAGKEVTLPKAKLSKTDQEYLRSLEASDNPFDPKD